MFALQEAIIIILIIIFIHIEYQQCIQLHEEGQVHALDWRSDTARTIYKKLVEKFGLPTSLNKEEGGGTMWARNISPYRRITLTDTSDKPLNVWCPLKLFEGYSNIIITDEARRMKQEELTKFAHLSYNHNNETLTIKSRDWQHLLIIYILALQIGRNTTSLREIKESDIIQRYGSKSIYELEQELSQQLNVG